MTNCPQSVLLISQAVFLSLFLSFFLSFLFTMQLSQCKIKVKIAELPYKYCSNVYANNNCKSFNQLLAIYLMKQTIKIRNLEGVLILKVAPSRNLPNIEHLKLLYIFTEIPSGKYW